MANKAPLLAVAIGGLGCLNDIKVEYTNYRGETSVRRLRPHALWFTSTEYHPEPQWILNATDLDRQVQRDFALKDMKPCAE